MRIVFYRFIYWNTRFLVGKTVWERLGGMALLEKISPGMDFEVQKTHGMPSVSNSYISRYTLSARPTAMPVLCHSGLNHLKL